MFEQEEKEGPVEGKKYTYNNVPGMIVHTCTKFLYLNFIFFFKIFLKIEDRSFCF